MSRGCEADAVVAGVRGTECEFSRLRAARIDDTVVVVEDFIHGNGDAHVRVRSVSIGLRIVLQGAVVAWQGFSRRFLRTGIVCVSLRMV